MSGSLFHKLRSLTQKLFPKKRRKCIEDWDFIMVFDIQAIQQIQAYFKKLQCQQHVRFQFIEDKSDSKVLVLIGMDQNIVIQQAHQLKILKIKNKRSFDLSIRQIHDRIDKAESQKSTHYADYLRFIRARYEKENKQILEQQKYSVFNKYKIQKYERNKEGQLFSSQEELRCKYNFLLSYSELIKHQNANSIQDSFRFPFLDIIKNQHYQEIVPIHKNSRYNSIIFDSVKNYVGSNDQTYFEFVGFLQKWLVFPAVIGLITTIFNFFFQYSADDSPGDFIYSLLIMVWSIYFITSWQNQSKWLKIKQGSGYNDQLWSSHQNLLQKQGLSKRISRVTGKWECYLPLKQKIQFYFISIGACVLISIASIFFMILSLNARGFVDPDHKLLYFQSISLWAARGGIFDSETWWGQIPNLIHVLVTNGFDQSVYRPLAKKLTKIQRHLNSKTHSDSIIMKFFIYQFIITFADFFYIAFVRFDIQGLREQLLSLFFIDIVRRLVSQSLIPRLKSKYISYSLKNKNFQKVTKQNQLRHYAILQVNKQNFESFDDYLEIITNFAYLALISSCFPLAPLLILIAHSVEVIQDKYKLIHIFRRRLPQKFVGMGYWKDIIVLICYMSIVTNILLFAFSSKQIVSIFPQIFQSGKDLVLGNIDVTTLLGGAATGVFSAMLTLGNDTLSTVTDTLDIFSSENTTNTFENRSLLDNNGWGSYNASGNGLQNFWINPTQQIIKNDTIPFSLQGFQPVPKQHQVEFIGILFLLEHLFLIGFILLRKMLSKRKNLADIFEERRAYKRRVKKYLSKDILAENIRDEVVKKLIVSENEYANEQNPLGIFDKLVSGMQQTRGSSNSEMSLSEKESISTNETGDFFSAIIEKLGQKAEEILTGSNNNQSQSETEPQNKGSSDYQNQNTKHQNKKLKKND